MSVRTAPVVHNPQKLSTIGRGLSTADSITLSSGHWFGATTVETASCPMRRRASTDRMAECAVCHLVVCVQGVGRGPSKSPYFVQYILCVGCHLAVTTLAWLSSRPPLSEPNVACVPDRLRVCARHSRHARAYLVESLARKCGRMRCICPIFRTHRS